MKQFQRNLIVALVVLLAAFGIFAACSGGNVTIKFETNGGAAVESITVKKGDEVTLPTPTYDAAHTFEGWYDNAQCTGEAVGSVLTAEKNRTLYAKWETKYPIQLELGGGKIGATDLYLKSGENVYSFMYDAAFAQERTPTLDADHTFGAWFVGDKELSESTVMTEAGITLTAKYKVKYTVHPYLQDLSDPAKYTQGKDFTGFDYAGEIPTVTLEGYVPNPSHEGSDPIPALSENASANVFTLYFNYRTSTVMLHANYPDGSDPITRLEAPVGSELALPTEEFSSEGYCLVGWSDSANGKVLYESSFVYDRLYNKEGAEAPAKMKVGSAPVALFAIWARGNIDMFGGSDLVYHFDESSSDVYIYRNGVFFKATYRADTKRFFIMDSASNILLQGQFSEGNTFSYYNEDLTNRTYSLYRDREIDDEIRLTFDGFNGVTYRQPGSGADDYSDGTFTREVEGTGSSAIALFRATFTSGLLKGQTLILRTGYITDSTGKNIDCFMVRAPEDVELGVLYRFADDQNYYPSVYVTLNGFGVATWVSGQQAANYYYSRNDDVVTLYDSQDRAVYEMHLATMDSLRGFYLYAADYDHTYEATDGSKLMLDGLYHGEYTTSTGERKTGLYLLYSSQLGGNVVTLTVSAEEVYTFYVNTMSETIEGEGDEEDTTVEHYTMRLVTANYGEYYYQAADGTYYTPLLVLDDEGAGTASLYGYPGVRTYTKFADGTYSYDRSADVYTFTLKNYYEVENMVTGLAFDAAELESFEFAIRRVNSNSVFYLSSAKLKTSDEDYKTVYKNGAEELVLVAGFAYYKAGDVTAEGQYTRQEGQNYVSFSAVDGDGKTVTYIFEVNDTEKTFERLTDAIGVGTMYEMTASGTSRVRSLTFDGRYGVIFTDNSGDEPVTVEGTYREVEETTFLGGKYFHFTSKDGKTEFDFMLYSSGSTLAFVRYNEKMAKRFSSDEGEYLRLDGFASAEYSLDGQTVRGNYFYYEEEGYILVIVASGSSTTAAYFDLTSENSVSRRGNEATSSCLYFDNQNLMDVYFALDGHGNLSAYSAADGELIDDEGIYRALGDGRYLFQYAGADGEPVNIYGTLVVVTMGGGQYLAIAVEHDGIAGVYVNEEDYTVLNLGAYGSGVRFNKNGIAESGQYVLVTDKISNENPNAMLYFYTDTDACIYEYSTARGTATPKKFSAFGFYTEKLEALNFSEYGYVFIEGERCYFTVNAATNAVTIFRSAKEGETPNQYGFVEDTSFGTFGESEKHYNGKTYYRSDGYSITFARKEGDTKYPILVGREEDQDLYAQLGNLSFSPRGNGEFSASATVKLDDNTSDSRDVNGVVVGSINEDGETELYLRVNANLGYYRFDLSIDYHGDSASRGENTYTITDMHYIVELPSINYLFYNYLISMLSGGLYSMENAFGTITVTKPCSEAGEVLDEEAYLDAEFGEMFAQSMLDDKGNPITVEHVSVEESRMGSNTLYTVTLNPGDGYVYKLRFISSLFQYTREYGFNIYALTRFQTFEDVDLGGGTTGTLEVERIIFSEAADPGAIFEVRLFDAEGTLIESESYSFIDDEGRINYIARTRTEATDDAPSKITATKYYLISLTERISGEVGDETADRVQPYTAVSVTVKTMTTTYLDEEDGTSFADIDEEGNIVLFVIGRTVYLVDTCTYREADKTYDIVTTGNRHFTVTTNEDGTLKFTQIVEEEAPEEAPEA